jgi:anti-sigma regulatory factor (Ser/Thr protein kinase)
MTARTVAYRHEAFPYAGHDEFVTSSANFLRAGVENDERAILVALGDKVSDVRDAMGSDAQAVEFVDMGVAGRNPARIVSVFQRFIAADDSGRSMRGLGEPVYPTRSPAALAEAQLHELLLNSRTLDEWDFWLGCPYDITELDEDALEAMRDSHPIIAGEDLDGCRGAELGAEVFATALPAVPADCRTYKIEGYDLAGVRSFIRTSAAALEVDGSRLEDLICAVNEAATNSMCHGAGAAVVSVWQGERSLICDVHDRGMITDVMAGRFEPSVERTRGRGLWLINHLCDLVQVRSSAAGPSVRMHIDL